jgi:hypothetical protein
MNDGRAPPRNMAGVLDFIPPELATLVDQAPEGEGWLHEIKLDGYRLAVRVAGKVTMSTRRGLDWTARFGPIAAAAGKLKARFQFSSSINAFATVRSAVANPSVKRRNTDCRSSRASAAWPCSRCRRARLVALRSSQERAPW